MRRPNRFIAEVEITEEEFIKAEIEDAKTAEKNTAKAGNVETVHVKNTGRCKELLVPGAEVWLTAPGTPGRKTKYDLVAVRKENGLLINMDSQAPNKVVKEWLKEQEFDTIKPEFKYGDSRVDFYMERQVAKTEQQSTETERQSPKTEQRSTEAERQSPKTEQQSPETEQQAAGEKSQRGKFEESDRDGEGCAELSDSSEATDATKAPDSSEPSDAREPSDIKELSDSREKEDVNGTGNDRQILKYLMEVKGCTLEVDGIGYFPDAPTQRGVKHIRELIRAQKEGYRAILAFVIQMDGITEVRPNIETHPEFGKAMDEARSAGVEILMLPCHVDPDELIIRTKEGIK